MAIAAVLSLVLGVFAGGFILPPHIADFIAGCSTYVLWALMLSVGFSVGGNRAVFRQLRTHSWHFLIIPIGTVIGSVFGGLLASLLMGRDIAAGTAVASGLGWYSLVGIMLTDLAGPDVGAIAFLANLLREILAFVSIPILVKHFGPYVAIAPAGATSEDTTLPMIMRHCREEIAIIAVLNGIILTAVVPLLVQFCYEVFR